MLPDPIVSEEASSRAKILLPQGGPESHLDALVSLASDPRQEVQSAAREALARIPEEQCARLFSDPSLPEPVARYFLDPAHLRPALLPALLANPSTPQDAITHVAAVVDPDVVMALLDQLDLLKTPALLALKENPTYRLWQKEPPDQGYVIELDLLELLIQEMQVEQCLAAEQMQAPSEQAQQPLEDADYSGGVVRKIARMKVAQRVKLALLGTREERAMLIRDPNRVVWRAVLSSPKLTEAEVEAFATLKNVSQDVLRTISRNRRFMKNYTILRNLVNNPRATIDVTLPLLNRLLPKDLRAVSVSKDLPDTVRKMAQKLVRSRSER